MPAATQRHSGRNGGRRLRITQEAVTNMLRHAQASNLLIRVQRLPQGLTLLISDDGQGFAPAADPGREGQRGMAGMAEGSNNWAAR
jgi:signal transduction histidine kinase